MQTQPIQIRRLRMWDVPKLLKFRTQYDYHAPFENKTHAHEPVIHFWLKMLWHRKRMVTLVAWSGDEIVGYLSMVLGKYRKFHGNAYVVSVAVKADERGRGIGTKLFNEIEALARSRGARRVEFDVFSQNTKALELYKRLGYEIEGVKRRAVENAHGSDDLIFMAKFL